MRIRRQSLALPVLLALIASPVAASEGGSSSTTEQQAAAIIGLAPEIGAALAPAGARSAADRDDRAALAKFYEARQYEPVWVTTTGAGAPGQAVVAELGKADDWGLEASAFRLPPLPVRSAELSRTDRANADVAISLAILRYARYARGGRMDPTALSRFIDRKPPLADPASVIEEAAKAAQPDAYLRGLHPQHPQFERLRQAYLALKSGRQLPQTEAAESAGVKKGATSDASIARRVLVNMEEWRWMPESLGDFYIWVNVPEFLIRVVRNGAVIHTERVVVGKTDTQTPIFSDEMEQIIFHPFWGIPDSIKQADILPTLLRGSTKMMERYNLRIQSGGRDIDPLSVDWTQNDIRKFHVYQPPGDTNLLGVVKFRFPNKHDVYMHDTPQKFLFNAAVRANSHGCMRVRDPQKLAEVILAEDQGWPAGRVATVVASNQPNNQINLKHKIPTHMTYFTVWVEDDGKLKTFADIYNHESKIALGLEGKAHLIPRDKGPVVAGAVGSLAETQTGGAGAKKDWMQKLWQN
jgi:murein L,D-transpeptidase YcbB/YkuD